MSYIVSGHPEMAPYEAAVIETITHPIDRDLDEKPGRERYTSEGRGPARFLTVVIELADREGHVVTAFPHRNPR